MIHRYEFLGNPVLKINGEDDCVPPDYSYTYSGFANKPYNRMFLTSRNMLFNNAYKIDWYSITQPEDPSKRRERLKAVNRFKVRHDFCNIKRS